MGCKYDEILLIKVERQFCQTFREKLGDLGIFDKSQRVKISGQFAELPVSEAPEKSAVEVLSKICYFDMRTVEILSTKDVKSSSPKESLTDRIRDSVNFEISSELLNDIPDSWEFYDDLLLLPSKSFRNVVWTEHLPEVLQVICKLFKVNRVARKNSVKDDDFRSPKTDILLGSDSWVKRKENGIIYQLDLAKCMFSIGNISEKIRVANFPCRGETVVDMFAGIGYFTLPYLVHAGAARVISCEWNPDSIVALKKNLRMAGVEDRCTILEGDNRLLAPAGVADRINLGLIPSSESSWPAACCALKITGGVMHIHGNVESGGGLEKRGRWRVWGEETSRKIEALLGTGWETEVLHIECVKSYAPRVHHLVLDLSCMPVKSLM